MAEYLRFVDAPDPDDSAYKYTSAEFAAVEETKLKDGVAYGYLNQLEITQSAHNEVKVDSGALISKGRVYIQNVPSTENDAKTLEIPVTFEGLKRKDIVFIEFDLDNAIAQAKVKEGAPIPDNPSEPTFTWTSDNVWQVPLVIIDVSSTGITGIEDARVVGNARVNPAFMEDISAPNISVTGDLTATNVVAEGGKVYFNAEKTAYLRYGANVNKLWLKLPDCDEVQIAMVTAGTSSSAPTPTENYPINTIYLDYD